MSGAKPAAVLTTEELIEIAIAEVHASRHEYALNFLKRMLAGEQPSEWDYAAAIDAANHAAELEEFLKVKK